MIFSSLETSDISVIPDFQPEGWDDLSVSFSGFIQSPHCFPLKLSVNDKTVAIGASLRHLDTAWLACIVVHRDYRGKGLGRAMTEELIKRLDSRIFKTVYLDATDAGFHVYTKLGFQTEDEYVHYRKQSNHPTVLQQKHPHIRPYREKDFHQIFQLDYKASAEHRKGIFTDWVKESIVYEENGIVHGYYLPNVANKPVIARTRPVGKALLQYHIERHAVVIPPLSNEYAIDFLAENGFEAYRQTKRMRLGARRSSNLQMLFNRVSGQLG